MKQDNPLPPVMLFQISTQFVNIFDFLIKIYEFSFVTVTGPNILRRTHIYTYTHVYIFSLKYAASKSKIKYFLCKSTHNNSKTFNFIAQQETINVNNGRQQQQQQQQH